MEQEILVSVYCLAYNHGKYIRSALDGFVSQKTNFRYEVIVHDDASTDDTATIIREYANKYPEIIKPIFQKENQYSKGIKIGNSFIFPIIKGKYVACCEGDDYWCDENKLQRQVDFLEGHLDYVACVHRTLAIEGMNNSPKFIMGKPIDGTLLPQDIIPRDEFPYHTSSLMYRKEFAFHRPDFVSSVPGVGDYPFSIYLSLSGKIQHFKEIMSVYRLRTDGSWSQRMSRNCQKNIKTNENLIKMIEMADDYSEGKYHEEFQRSIAYYQYSNYLLKAEYRQAIKEPHYKTLSFKEKLKIRLKAYFPWLLKIKRKLKKQK